MNINDFTTQKKNRGKEHFRDSTFKGLARLKAGRKCQKLIELNKRENERKNT